MHGIPARLKALDHPIRVGIIGAGTAGKGLFYQAAVTPGIAPVGLCDVVLSKAVGAAEEFGRPYRVIYDAGGFEDALADGLLPVCEDAELICRSESVDVLIEASNAA